MAKTCSAGRAIPDGFTHSRHAKGETHGGNHFEHVKKAMSGHDGHRDPSPGKKLGIKMTPTATTDGTGEGREGRG